MKRPSVKECLEEVQRLRAENERLQRLVLTKRPEIDQMRRVESELRDYIVNGAETLKRLHSDVCELLGTKDADLPGFLEMAGILSDGRERVHAALESLDAVDAVDPHVESEGTPSTRV